MIAPASPDHPKRPRVEVGVSGWSYDDWHGPLYPPTKSRGFRGLPLVASFVDFMEVNATFYRPLPRDMAQRWVDETPDGFGFVVKAHQSWSHEAAPFSGDDADIFAGCVDEIASRGVLYGVLFQLPPRIPDLDGTRLESAISMARRFAPAPLFVEFRDPRAYCVSTLGRLEREELSFVNVDLPEVRGLPGRSTINTTGQGFVRLHGRSTSGWENTRASRDERYDYMYSDAEITEITERVEQLAERTRSTLVAANNHFRAQGPATAVAIRARVRHEKIAVPRRLLDAFPQLDAYAEPFDDASESPDLILGETDASPRP